MIWVYTNCRSTLPGSPIDLHISSERPTVRIEIVRDGRAPAVVHTETVANCKRLDVPIGAVENGCNWPVATTIIAGEDWPTGMYLVHARHDEESPTCTAFFILRAAEEKRAALLVLSTNTYNAYNNFGGANTYSGDGFRRDSPATEVSFLRPIPLGFLEKPFFDARMARPGAPDPDIPYLRMSEEHGLNPLSGSAGWATWEREFVRWADEVGIEFDYASSEDLETHPDILDQYKLLLSVGHDEYWSWGMRDTVEHFVSGGGNVAFFSGNSCFWQVRLDQAKESMTTYKAEWRSDPVLGTESQQLLSGMWSHHLINRPENRMTGVGFAYGGYALLAGAVPRGSGGYTVYRPEHWVFESCDLRYGDVFGGEDGIVGYECDGCRFSFKDGLPVPLCDDGSPPELQILAISPAQLWNKASAPPTYYPEPKDVHTDLEIVADQVAGAIDEESLSRFSHGHATMTTYTKGGTVFSASTTDWTFGLNDRKSTVSTITANVIRRLSRHQE